MLGCAAPAERDLQPLSVVSIHEAPGRSKADVCRSSRDWAAVTFRDSKAVIEVLDLESGTMIGKGRVTLLGYAGTPFPVDFTLRVDCRDGRARVTFDGWMSSDIRTGQRYPLREDSLNMLQTKARTSAADMAADLAKALNAKSF